MKNLLILVGSARNGNSLFAANYIAKVASKTTNISHQIVQLSESSINNCDGCLECDSSGSCHYNDDMAELLNKVKSSDGIVFISPTRWSLLSGDLKVFMDRLNPLAGKDLFNDKKSFLVAVGQTNCTDSISISRALESLKFFSDDAGFQCFGSYAIENCLDANDLSSKTELLADFEGKINQYIDSLN